MKIISYSLLALLLLALPAQALVKPGLQMPDLRLPDSSHQNHSLAELAKGKVALVVYWSLTCPHCHKVMPHLLFMNKRLTGNNFIMIFVNSDGASMAQAIATFGQEQKMPAPWLIDEGAGDSMPLAQTFDIVATPSVFLFNTNGKLVMAQESDIDLDLLLETIQKSF